MMPGEKVSATKRAIVDYLLALQRFDSQFPGFEHDIHGIEVERDRDGQIIYFTRCLTS
jgi:arginine/lysine/ornithine decarboxylase